MKDEEFNNFLRERADSFELKPSSGSFEAVQRKMQRKNKRRGIIVFLSLLAGIIAGAYFLFSNGETQSAAPMVSAANSSTQNETVISDNQNTKTADNGATIDLNNSIVDDNNDNSIDAINSLPTNTEQSQHKSTRYRKENKSQKVINSSSNTIAKEEETSTESEANDATQNEFVNSDNKIEGNEGRGQDIAVADSISKVLAVVAKDIEPENKKRSATDSSLKKCNCADSKWALKAYFNPFTAAYINLVNSKEDVSSSNSMSNLGTSNNVAEYSEELNSGWSVGLKAERKLSSKWKLGFGLGYSSWSIDQVTRNVGYSKDSTETYAFDTISNQNIVTGYSVYSLAVLQDSSRVNVLLRSIQMPVNFGYRLISNKRWQFDLTAGLTATYIVSGKYTDVYSKQFQGSRNSMLESEKVWQSYRRFNMNMAFGFEANYKISNCTSLFAAQTFSTPLFTIQNKNSQAPARRPLFIGVETGVKINF